MATLETAIPLEEPAAVYPFSAGPKVPVKPEKGLATALETERFGILASPPPQVDGERRIEAWIASNLDLDVPTESAPRNIWDRIVDRLPALRRAPKKRQLRGGAETSFSEWAQFSHSLQTGNHRGQAGRLCAGEGVADPRAGL